MCISRWLKIMKRCPVVFEHCPLPSCPPIIGFNLLDWTYSPIHSPAQHLPYHLVGFLSHCLIVVFCLSAPCLSCLDSPLNWLPTSLLGTGFQPVGLSCLTHVQPRLLEPSHGQVPGCSQSLDSDLAHQGQTLQLSESLSHPSTAFT